MFVEGQSRVSSIVPPIDSNRTHTSKPEFEENGEGLLDSQAVGLDIVIGGFSRRALMDELVSDVVEVLRFGQ